MKTFPPGDTAQRQMSRRAFISTVLVVAMSAVTVLGAVLLSTLDYAPDSQIDAREPESAPVELIPTAAAATPPPVTLIPSQSDNLTDEPLTQASPTIAAGPTQQGLEQDGEDERTPRPSPSRTAETTPTVLSTAKPTPIATPWPCADGKPIDWTPYHVKQGDTLFSLARRHSTSMYWVIYYNCLKSEQLWAGQELYLPPLPTPEPSSPPTLVPEQLPSETPEDPSTPQPSPTQVPSQINSPTPFPSATTTGTARPSPEPTQTPTPTAATSPGATATSTPTAEPSGGLPNSPTASPPPEAQLPPTPTAYPPATPTGTSELPTP